MSLMQDNKFLVALGGGTLVAAIALYFVGARGGKHYNEAKEQYDAAAGEVSQFERLPLYPKQENRDGKSKALDEYKKSVEAIQAAFKPYRIETPANISPQEFTNHLLAANTEIRAAFDASQAVVPEAFFVGFETYKARLASGNATGVLDYQLGGIKKVLLELAKAQPTELRNLCRPPLPEEEGKPYTPAPTDVSRGFPLEITFIGTEKSARDFLSAIEKTGDQYVTIRTLRISNEKKDPPRAADAKFEKPAAPKAATPSGGAFGGFVLPGEEAAPTPEPAAPAAAPAPAKPADGGKILAQVLGEEKVQVFVRLDLMQFLPEKKLP